MSTSLRDQRLLEHQLRQADLLSSRQHQPLSRHCERPSSPPPPQQRIDRRSLPKYDLGYSFERGNSISAASLQNAFCGEGPCGGRGVGPPPAWQPRVGDCSLAVPSFSFDSNGVSAAVANFPRRQPLQKEALWPTGAYRDADLEQLARPPAGVPSRDLHSRNERRFSQKLSDPSLDQEGARFSREEHGAFQIAAESQGVLELASPPLKARTTVPSTQPPELRATPARGLCEGNGACGVLRGSQEVAGSALTNDPTTSRQERRHNGQSVDPQWVASVKQSRGSQPPAWYSGEVAAGKPSDANNGSFLQFHLSLRSPEPRRATSGAKPRRLCNSSAPYGNLKNTSRDAAWLEDERALEEMGFVLSPRERAFFRKQQRMKRDRAVSEVASRGTGGAAKWKENGGEFEVRESGRLNQRLGVASQATSPARLSFASKACHLPPWVSATTTVRGGSFRGCGVKSSVGDESPTLYSCSERPGQEQCGVHFDQGASVRDRGASFVPDTLEVPSTFSKALPTSGATVCGFCRQRLMQPPNPLYVPCGDMTMESHAAPRCVACAAFEDALETPATFRLIDGQCRPVVEGRQWQERAVSDKEKMLSSAECQGPVAPANSKGYKFATEAPPSEEASTDGRPTKASAENPLVHRDLTLSPRDREVPSLPQRRVSVRAPPKPQLSAKPKLRLVATGASSAEASSGGLKNAEKEYPPWFVESVWDRPRVVATVCRFLPLSKLLLLRQCSKTFLQATQYRMRFILYKALQCLIRSEPPVETGYGVSKDLRYSTPHCPFSATDLIKLLNLSRAEVQTLREGQLPPPFPPEAATPRMSEVARALREYWRVRQLPARPLQEQQTPSRKTPEKKGTLKSKSRELATASTVSQCVKQKIPTQNIGPKRPELQLPPAAVHTEYRESPDLERAEHLNLYMTRLQREEEERIAWEMQHQALQHKQQQMADRFVQHSIDPAISSVNISRESLLKEPASFRRVRHSFLKLWNYDEATVRLALQRATTCAYPSWLFDACNVLLRSIFQVCSNSLTVPPLKELLPMLSPNSLRLKPEGFVRADCYLWSRMARISGYGIEELVTPAQSLLRVRERQRTWTQPKPKIYRLRALALSNVHELWPGRNLNAKDLRFAADAGVGVEGEAMKVGPLVMDSLEGKMMRIPPEFLAEFVVYGKQQQMLHAESASQHVDGTIHRRAKFSTELLFLMDLYEWVAAILTHIRQRDAATSDCLRKIRSREGRSSAVEEGALGRSRVFGLKMFNRSAREPATTSNKCQKASDSNGAGRPTVAPMPKQTRSSPTPVSASAAALRQLIEEQGLILRRVCELLSSIKERKVFLVNTKFRDLVKRLCNSCLSRGKQTLHHLRRKLAPYAACASKGPKPQGHPLRCPLCEKIRTAKLLFHGQKNVLRICGGDSMLRMPPTETY